MLILFINAHRKTEEGRARFAHFHSKVRSALRGTVYFGNEVSETVRAYDELEDYIYDEVTFRMEERARRRFESLEYVFVDGDHHVPPWSDLMVDVLLLIRKSLNASKKIYCNDFAHFAAYFCLATNFDKHCAIAVQGTQTTRQLDYNYVPESGDLFLKGKRVCNSGVKLVAASRPFADRSANAVGSGIVLSSKFDYVVFNSKSGSKILGSINVPFAFYWKSKVFCTPRAVSQVKAEVLFETEGGEPLAFTFRGLLSTQGLCGQFLQLLRNWLGSHVERELGEIGDTRSYQSIAFENKLEFRRTLNSSASMARMTRSNARPLSSKSKFSTIEFEKPVVRCSGKYETLNQRYLHEELQKKSLNLGKSRMTFKGGLVEMQIENYVQREPSRPTSSHKFREVNKQKWVGRHDFFNC